MDKRTGPRKKAQQIVKYFRHENPDYNYIKAVFKHLREELSIEVKSSPKKLPYVPTEEEIKRYYEAIWQEKNMQDMLNIVNGKGKKDRKVPFPKKFREPLAFYAEQAKRDGSSSLFESSWKKPYSDRGIRKKLEKYSKIAGVKHNISPHQLRHFLFTWLKKKGIDDALIQPYSGHETRASLEVYSKLSLTDAQNTYDDNIGDFPI
jgi:integrase/recombinase XerD